MKRTILIIGLVLLLVASFGCPVPTEEIAVVEEKQLTTHTADDWNLAWSPDGRKIAFTSDRTGNWDIWVMESDGGNQRELTTHTADDWLPAWPAWSPDGRKIAFHLKVRFYTIDRKTATRGDFVGTAELIDGKLQIQTNDEKLKKILYSPYTTMWGEIKDGVAVDWFVTYQPGSFEHIISIAIESNMFGYISKIEEYKRYWSPDGRKIAFTSDRTGNWDIWVMDSDGGNWRRLTTHTAGDLHPAWSPDGKKIAFTSDRTGNWDIWVMDSDGGNQRQLTTHIAGDEFPAWSPDGKKIAFTSDRAGNWDIWVLILE